jgi:hypothetical protein
MLQQKRPKGYNGVAFEGTAVGPDCECSSRIVAGYTPIIGVPVALTSNRTIPDEIKNAVMKKRQQTLYAPELPETAKR